mmetsp:Transcript_68374/g.182418  ORF Transcript_68374/g.182418 Transcript_68374/m.182418 type:complete len:81 (+) Transcript_68374:211-453(+)
MGSGSDSGCPLVEYFGVERFTFCSARMISQKIATRSPPSFIANPDHHGDIGLARVSNAISVGQAAAQCQCTLLHTPKRAN